LIYPARAILKDSDIFLLDDPLAALDSHVGKKIFDNVICGLLKSKTVVLVTHQLHLLPHFDLIIVMKDGSVAEFGTYSEIAAKTDIIDSISENMVSHSSEANGALELQKAETKPVDIQKVEERVTVLFI
jgi:ABC-type multidrug transport system fused ATPase/permease subunit